MAFSRKFVRSYELLVLIFNKRVLLWEPGYLLSSTLTSCCRGGRGRIWAPWSASSYSQVTGWIFFLVNPHHFFIVGSVKARTENFRTDAVFCWIFFLKPINTKMFTKNSGFQNRGGWPRSGYDLWEKILMKISTLEGFSI